MSKLRVAACLLLLGTTIAVAAAAKNNSTMMCVGLDVGTKFNMPTPDIVDNGSPSRNPVKVNNDTSILIIYTTYPEGATAAYRLQDVVASSTSLTNVVASTTHKNETAVSETVFQFICNTAGVALVNVTMAMTGCENQYFIIEKLCGQPDQSRKGFAVGSAPGRADIVTDGIVHSDYQLANPFLIPSSLDNTTLYLSMANHEEQKILSPIVVCDETIVKAQINSKLAAGGVVTSVSQPFEIFWNCHAPGKALVSISFHLPGYHSVELDMVKDCTPPVVETAESGMSAWFKFVIVIGCVGGAFALAYAYRYHSGFRGKEAIPFHEQFYACFDWAKSFSATARGYRPQAQDEFDDVESPTTAAEAELAPTRYGTI
eukprot:GILJ01005190.1.p1 GENE.GILJ01005190.1~~GILJ01005190.1.p1  ORF type:complete len:373 (-),score=40.57 GILJ01005190.1:225-1343(-)